MTAVSLGWKLIGVSGNMLAIAFVLGAFAFTMDSPRMRLLRRVCVALAGIAAMTLIVAVIVGPGAWCGAGDAYRVPGCA